MTNNEDFEKAVEAMRRIKEAPLELRQTVYCAAIAQSLARIAEALEPNKLEKYKIMMRELRKGIVKAIKPILDNLKEQK